MSYAVQGAALLTPLGRNADTDHTSGKKWAGGLRGPPIPPFLQSRSSEKLALDPRQRRQSLALARPGSPGPRERSHSTADGRLKNGRKSRPSGKDNANQKHAFLSGRFFGKRVARPLLRTYFAARLGRAALSNLLLEPRGESGHSRRNQTTTR